MPQSTRLYTAGKGGAASGSTPPGLVPANAQAANASSLPAAQTILVNTETVLVDPAVQGGGTALILSIPPGGPCEQEPFDILVSGYFNLGTSSTVNLRLYSGTSLTPGSNTLLKASGAISAFSGKTNFWIRARLIYDSVSGTLTGTCQFLVNNTIVAEAAFANVPTGINNANNPVASFVLSVTFGTAGTQLISVKDFGVNH